MRLDKMVTRKEHGGLGFRSLHGFNLEMLGKLGGKFISNLDTMVSRVFKARYYPNGSFLLSAKVGHNQSYVWRSICSSQVVLREVIR